MPYFADRDNRGKRIKNTFGYLLQERATGSTVDVTDGDGFTVTASFNLTASWAINTVNGGSGGLPHFGNTVIVDQVNGSATGSRNGTPFNNLTQAKTAAVKGDLIVVYPGTYAENNLVKDGVNWYFHEGAIVNYTGSRNGSGSLTQPLGIFDDRQTGPVNYSVAGYGQFTFNSQDNTASLGTFVSTNSSSAVTWKGQSVAFAHFPGSETSLGSRAALHGKHGTIFAEFDTIYDAGLNQRFDTGQVDEFDEAILLDPNCTGVYWALGDMFVRFRYMSKMTSYMIWGDQTAGNLNGYNLYYEGDLMDGAGGATGQTTKQSTIYMDAPSPGFGNGGTYNWKTWGNVKEIRNCGINLFQIGRHYITAEKISAVGSLFSIPLGAQVWITAQKITSEMPWISVNDDSRVFVDCQQFESTGSTGFLAGFLTQTTSSYLDVRSNYVNLSGSLLPMVRSLGTTIFRGMTLDGSQNNAPLFLLDGPGVQIENCKLSASLSQFSISGSVAASLINHGSSTNRPIASNVTVLGEGIFFDGTGSAISASNVLVVGNVVASSFTGSLQGTASWSNNLVGGSGTTLVTGSTYPITSSWSNNAKLATSASVTDVGNPNTDYNVVFQDGTGRFYTNGGGTSVFSINPGTAAIKATSFLGNATTATTATSASYAITASFALNAGGSSGTTLFTASLYQITSSWANNAITAKTAVSATSSLTASRVEAGSVVIGADSNITGANNITASGVIFGSALAGNDLAIVGGGIVATDSGGRLHGMATGSNLSYTASWANNALTSSFVTASNVIGVVTSASYAASATATIPTRLTVNDLTASIAISGSLQGSASWAANGMTTSSTYPITASYSLTASAVASYLPYALVTTNSANFATISFAQPGNYQINLPVSKLYSFTHSFAPPLNFCSDILLYVSHSATTTSSLSFPASWQNVGGTFPTAITSSTIATLWLRAIDTNQVIGTWISNR